jgi:predicted Rossmann fold flavoprotein
MCAIEAGRRGRRVLVFDHADKPGKKILISGGGRCNFTNLHTSPHNFLSQNPHFAKSALARFTPSDMIALVEKHGIDYHEKTLGELFCDRSAQQIVQLLERECAEAGVALLLETRIAKVTRALSVFTLETSAGLIQTESLVVATGGLSIPKMGASGLGYDLARQFGLAIVEPQPGLVPLVFHPADRERWCDLAGLSANVIASSGKTHFREKALITHRGLSGPAVLQVSSYWRPGQPLSFDLAPSTQVFARLFAPNARRDSAAAAQALRTVLPTRLAERWLTLHPLAQWTNLSLAAAERQLHAWTITPAGTEGFAKAEVTTGGVDTAGLDARTLQSRAVPGLFFIGEVVDVTGWLGGYNFQWAWASGFAAGQVA